MGGIADLAVRVAAETDQYTQEMQNVGQESERTASWLEENWLKVGAATAAAGAGIEALARKQAPLTEQTQRLAAALDMNEDEIRGMAKELSNVTFPIEDVLGLMETGRQQGIKSAEQLAEYAQFWDMVGDATGESGVQLGEAGVALRAVGIAAGEEGEALDAFGYITQETTGDVGEFLTFIERTGPELREMGADVDDAAAIMGILEHEFGMTARMARQEFRQAVNEADGDLDAMLETMGIGEGTFKDYQQAVADSSDVIGRNAEIHEESYTAMQRMQHWASELTYQYGDLISMVGNFTPLLITMGPLIRGLSAAKGVWSAVTSGSLLPALGGAIASVWSFTAALLANPITWIVVLIVGLVAAIILLWKNWDEVSEWLVNAWEWVKEKVGMAIDAVVDFFSEMPGRVWEWLVNLVERFLEWRQDMIDKAKEFGLNILSTIVNFFKSLPGRVWDFLKETWQNLLSWGNDMISSAREKASEIFSTIVDYVKGLPGELLKIGRDMIVNFAKGIKDKIGNITGAIGDVAGKVRNFLPFSPAREGPLKKEPNFADYLLRGIEGAEKDVAGGLDRVLTGFAPRAEVAIAGGGQAGGISIGDSAIERLTEKIASFIQGAQVAGAGAGGGDIYVYIGNEQVDAYVHRSQDRRRSRSNGR